MSFSSTNVFGLASMMHVITLATCFKQEVWTAPVYYHFVNKKFYFFSNPDSRHIKEAMFSVDSDKNQVAASVFLDDTDFKKMKGLQMQGQVAKIENIKEATTISFEYIQKFKIKYNKKNIIEFFKEKYKARLYAFIPETIYYMDNSLKLNSREKIEI